MTSDAKIGLLLGLVFIFIIAFIINGLPSFNKDTNNNELTDRMVNLQNNPPGIAAKEREVIEQRRQGKKRFYDEVQAPSVKKDDVRFSVPLPGNSGAKETKRTIEIKPPAPTIAKKSEVQESKSVQPPLPKVYVVNEDDSLADIAKKLYGPQEGNKRTNITRIFDANRKLLKSPDEIYVGQKLIIPPLPASYQNKGKVDSILTSQMLEKVKSIGQRHLLPDGHSAKPSKQYVVREGDSLWEIAAEQLGTGSRYAEIARLNAEILDDEDTLTVGMRLKMPTQ